MPSRPSGPIQGDVTMIRSSRIVASTILAALLTASAGAGPAAADGDGDGAQEGGPTIIFTQGDNNHIGISGGDSHVGAGQISGNGHTVGSTPAPLDTVSFFVRNDSRYTLHLVSVSGIAGGVTGPTDLAPQSSPTAYQGFAVPSTFGPSTALATYDILQNGASMGTLKIVMGAALYGQDALIGCNSNGAPATCPVPSSGTSVNVVNAQ
ncbi:hypothetical protein [Streptomyces sp. Tue6028]|uniref:hypothetical protein n=1 Tax=Streptomyces sp. Tue6028 TaxID=2036037 RepID=UPI003D71059A